MAIAEQATREFKGDHISAKMFRGEGSPLSPLVPCFNCSMDEGSQILEIGANGFDFGALILNQGHVGWNVIIHSVSATPRDGTLGFRPSLSGSLLKTSIISVQDSSHAILADPAPSTFTGATVDIGPDDTTTLLNTLLTNGSTGEGLSRIIPTGCYFATPGQISVPNPGSLIWRGQGSRFNTIIRSNDPDSDLPVLQMGNGIIDSPHSWVIENFTVSKAYGPGPALYFDRIQIGIIRDVIITDLGLNGVGIDTPQNHYIFGEIIFDHVSVYGGDGFGGTGLPQLKNSIGMRLFPTSNVILQNCNIEDVETGLYVVGEMQCTVTMTGGHFERIEHAIFLGNCQPFIDHESLTGNIYLRSDVVNGDLRLSSNSTLWSNGSIVDCGFGNRIRRTSSTPLNGTANAVFASGLAFEGDEWLSVPGAIDDPTFLRDIADVWTAGGGATVSTVPVAFPGVKHGRALAISAGVGGNGYAERTVDVDEGTDYLLHVGLDVQWSQSYQIVVSDSGGTLWDTGTWAYPDALRDFQSFKVFRKRIPTGTGITSLTIRIYAIAASQITICPLLLLSKSEIKFESDMLSAGTGYSESGSGINFSISQNLNTGSAFSFKIAPHPDLAHYGRCFVRAVVTDNSTDPLKTGSIGIGGVGNALGAGPIVKLLVGADVEYVIPISAYPAQSQVIFHSFAGVSNTIQIKELGLYVIKDDATVVDRLRISGRDIDTLDSAGNIRVPATTAFSGRDLRFISTAPLDGLMKNPNIIAMGPFAFNPNQGTIVCVNSKPAGFPNWEQTSRVYDFTADAGSNTLEIAALGHHYESTAVPFEGESFVITETTASGLSVGTNYWVKVSAPLVYEVYTDPSMVSRVTLGDGTGKLTASPYAMFLQLSTSMFGVGFGDATNNDGVTPWATDTNNENTTGMPPFVVINRRNTTAVKESTTKSGIYTGYPIFPMFSGGGGIFFSSSDPEGQALWDGSYPPVSSVCLWTDSGDGRVSVRKGPAPLVDDGSGWVDISEALWSLVDSDTISTPYQVDIDDPSDSRAVGISVVPTSHVSQAATPLISAGGMQVSSVGRTTVKSLGVNATAPTTDGNADIGGAATVGGAMTLTAQTASSMLKVNASKIVESMSASDVRTFADVYSKAEIDTLLAGKSNTGHGHTMDSQGAHTHGGAVPSDGPHTHTIT